MAQDASLYLPDLSKLFAGEASIRSWFDIPYKVLQTYKVDTEILDRWRHSLQHERVRAHLQRQSPSWDKPNATSQKLAEQATAAINISPSSNNHYDVQQIRDDANWITKQLNIDQIQSLRIVLLEWQKRPQLHLQAGYSEPEIASLKDVYSNATAFDGSLESATFLVRDEDDFSTKTARQRRQIFIHFQECIGYARFWLAAKDPGLAAELKLQSLQEEPVSDEQMQTIVQLTASLIESVQKGPEWEVIDADSNYIWSIGNLFHIKCLLQIMVVTARSSPSIPGPALMKWFTTMGDCLYFSELQPSPLLTPKEREDFLAMVTLTSLILIDPANTIAQLELNPKQHWMGNQELVADIQENLFNATDASCRPAMPVAFAWSLILQKVRNDAIEAKDRRDGPMVPRAIDTYDSATGRRSSIPNHNVPMIYEEIIETISSHSPVPDPISGIIRHLIGNLNISDQLAEIVWNNDPNVLPAFQAAKMQVLQELIRIATDLLPEEEKYGATILTPQFAILESGAQSPREIESLTTICTWFLGLDGLVENTLDVAAARFPYEALPFLRMCRLLARGEIYQNGCQYVTYRLQNLESFTQLAQGPLSHYHTIDEEENANRVELDQTSWAFTPGQHQMLLTSGEQQRSIIIPVNTLGDVISTSMPPVIRWKLAYSGFHVLGEWLERHFNGTLFEVLSEQESPAEVASELILLLANLIMSTLSPKNTGCDRPTAVAQLLSESSEHLTISRDIIALVFDILEQELQAYHHRPSTTFDTSVLHATLVFSIVILQFMPSRFWQAASRTSLVDSRGGVGLLFTLILGTESFTGSPLITESTISLYDEMVAAALRSTSQQSPEKQWREKAQINAMNGKARSISNMIHGMTENMLSILETLPNWRSRKNSQKIVASICSTFRKILFYANDIGSSDSQLRPYMAQGATAIVRTLSVRNVEDAKTSPIITQLFDTAILMPSFSSSPSGPSSVRCLLALAESLVICDGSQEKSSGLEICLLNLLPLLVRQLELDVQTPAHLIRLLLKALASERSVSLLGHLGTASAIDLINVLTSMTKMRDDRAISCWQLLTAFIGKDQQWLSVVLLTGRTPDKVKPKTEEKLTETTYRGVVIMDQASELLGDIENQTTNLRNCRTLAGVLRFVIAAQQNWAWALQKLQSKQDVFVALIRFVKHINKDDKTELGRSKRRLVALIVELCSVHLQHAKAIRDIGLMRTFRPLIEWLTLNAIEVNEYNKSLHLNIGKNFKSRFDLDLSDFKINRSYAQNSDVFYDMSSLDFVLSMNDAWKRTLQSKTSTTDNSFRIEVERANANLETVEADVQILRSFHDLIIEHAAFFKEDSGLRNIMAHIAARCLKANAARQPDGQLFDRILFLRAEMVITLEQCLVEQHAYGSDSTELLSLAWTNAMACAPSYEAAVAVDDLPYWRMCLSTVFLAMQFHLRTEHKDKNLANSTTGPLHRASSIMPYIIEISTTVIGEGLHTAVSLLVEQTQSPKKSGKSMPIEIKDIALIAKILETILRLPHLEEFATQISERFISTDTIESAVKLFSWAHLLANESTNNDPVCAELAMRLLVSLSSLQLVAEEMAVQGVFNSLLTARVTQVLQGIPNGTTSLDSRQHCRSLYTIWAEGFIPLSVNLLHAVQGPVAAESSSFINSFPDQLRNASQAFKPQEGSFITLQMAKECSSLSLLSFILDGYRTAGPSAAVDPSSVQVVRGFDENKAALRSDVGVHMSLSLKELSTKIVPLSEREASSLGERQSGVVNSIMKELQLASLCLVDRNASIEEDD